MIMNANSAIKPDLKSVVTFVAKGEIEKNSKTGKILNIRKAYITGLFFYIIYLLNITLEFLLISNCFDFCINVSLHVKNGPPTRRAHLFCS